MATGYKDAKFFVICKEKYIGYKIHDNKAYDLTTAVRKLLALDELKDDKETSYHLQEVDFSMVDKPLVLKDEVKTNGEDKEQMDIPF